MFGSNHVREKGMAKYIITGTALISICSSSAHVHMHYQKEVKDDLPVTSERCSQVPGSMFPSSQ